MGPEAAPALRDLSDNTQPSPPNAPTTGAGPEQTPTSNLTKVTPIITLLGTTSAPLTPIGTPSESTPGAMPDSTPIGTPLTDTPGSIISTTPVVSTPGATPSNSPVISNPVETPSGTSPGATPVSVPTNVAHGV
ncbi:hypothetical protein BJ085DRAFT_32415 [Dimargaris cristalligena]|uniref:Uncharacterized protein n=1 Tax=Dimargaris cristalligena TaxID=215637 RepID=A0A4P9ZKX4_9FUNG|nr:hypothetical protein BJ085DRAFT_32415 [Dimargaris cristalligena]|eukprot:RKP33718.1 hypothetical protein BJ085DRAFT_32415 [Dimargaris cristalligena]